MSKFSRMNWSSFNSGKLFYHVNRWKLIQEGKVCPPPALITVDPSNCCNLACEWCNAWKVRENQRLLSREILLDFAKFISEWKAYTYGVEAVCIAGGGEPLCNPHVGEFLNELSRRNINTATVTNGILIDDFIKELLLNEYVAVSVDAATATTFNKYKGQNPSSRIFDKIIANIEKLCKASRETSCNLGKNSLSNGINYRMLLYKDNIGEIVEAARIAQELGCNSLHIRPASIPYDGQMSFSFSEDDISLFKDQVEEVESKKKDNFGFYYTLGKFDDKFNKCNNFKHCRAIFMTGTLMPPLHTEENSYCFNVCCDRRSDSMMRLLTNECDISKIAEVWGSASHWNIYKEITEEQINEVCPRCTYYEHNKIFENCIDTDNMLINFI